MFTAEIGTYKLDLELSAGFDLVTVSQLWNFDKLRGNSAPSISFPYTENNRAILNDPNRFELRRNGRKEYSGFRLCYYGYLLMSGTLVLQDGFSGYVRGAVGDLAAANEDKKITDYNLPEVEFDNKESFDPATDDYCAPVIVNRNFYKDVSLVQQYKLTDESVYEETLLQHYHRETGYFVNSRTEGIVDIPSTVLDVLGFTSSERPTNVISPMLYLFRALQILLKANMFFLRQNAFAENADLNQLVIYNNYSINELSVYGAQLNTGQSKSEQERYSLFPFRYYSQALGLVKYKNMLPPVTIKEFILGVQNFINLAIVLSEDMRYDIVDREEVLIGNAVDIDKYFTGEWILPEKKDSVIEFKMNYDNNDELFSSFYKDLSTRDSDFGTDVASISALEAIASPSVGELRRVTAENKIFEYQIETVTDIYGVQHEQAAWKFISIDFQNGKYNKETSIDKPVETIETSFSTCAKQTVAEVMQVGAFNLRKNSESSFSPRIMFESSNTCQNNTFNYFLGYTGPKNLIDTRWKHTARFLSRRQPVEGYFSFPIGVLTSIIKDVQTSAIRGLNHTKYATRHGEFVIDKITTRFTHAGIGMSKVEGYKVG